MSELYVWDSPYPIARRPVEGGPVYAVDDRPPLWDFRFYKVEPYVKPFMHYRVPKLPVVKFVPDGELPDPPDAELWFTECYHGPEAPYPEPPTPEEILSEASGLGLLAFADLDLGMVSDRGGKYGYVVKSRQNVYNALRRQGMSKSKAARIANAGRTSAARHSMAKKAARTRKRRGGK